jgi:hypothetical protein
MNDKPKLDIRPLGPPTIMTVMDPNDFSIYLVINGQAAIQLNLEQLDNFAKEVVIQWASFGTGRDLKPRN